MNDIDIDTQQYHENREEFERETQEKILKMIEQIEPPKGFHFNVAFPTSYLEDMDGVAVPQRMALGDAFPLFDLLHKYGLHIMYDPPMHNPKVVGIIIGGDWTEVSVEWELE